MPGFDTELKTAATLPDLIDRFGEKPIPTETRRVAVKIIGYEHQIDPRALFVHVAIKLVAVCVRVGRVAVTESSGRRPDTISVEIIDHSCNGVASVNGGGAVTQHIDLLDHRRSGSNSNRQSGDATLCERIRRYAPYV